MGALEVGSRWLVRRLAGCPLGLGGVESLVQHPAQRPVAGNTFMLAENRFRYAEALFLGHVR